LPLGRYPSVQELEFATKGGPGIAALATFRIATSDDEAGTIMRQVIVCFVVRPLISASSARIEHNSEHDLS